MKESLRRRVARLDARDPLSGACNECGGPPPKGAKVEYEVTWADDEEGEEAGHGPTHCPVCGRTLVLEVHWPPEAG